MVLRVLNVFDSLEMLKKHRIPTAPYQKITNPFELARIRFSFPWVLKIVSDKISHKTDKKGVYLNITSREDANTAFTKLQRLDPHGTVLVQTQAEGIELIIGSKKDVQFDATILVGIGGTLVEILQDTALRVLPITKNDARKMITEIQHQKMLNGFRGKPPVNKKQLAGIIIKTAQMIQKEKFLELDINPLIATQKGIMAVDARIVK